MESEDIFEKIQQDFDDISSIYTDNVKLNNLEDTLKRIKMRDVQIEQMSHRDHINELNNQIGQFENLPPVDDL